MRYRRMFYTLSGIAIAFASIGLFKSVGYPILAEGIYIPFVTTEKSDPNTASMDETQPVNTPTPDMTGVTLDPNIRAVPPTQEVDYETIDLDPNVPFNDKYFLLVEEGGERVAYLVPESMLEAKLKEVGNSYIILESPPAQLLEQRKKMLEELEAPQDDTPPVMPEPSIEFEDPSKVTPPAIPVLP